MNLPAQHSSYNVAVVGGGRWGWILTRVLSQMDKWVNSVHLVSKRTHPTLTKQYLDEFENHAANFPVRLIDNLSEILADPAIEIAVVANMPNLHFSTARELLRAGKHVLVEKPFVLHSEEGVELIEIAKQHNLGLAVGLEFMASPTIRYFKKYLDGNVDRVARIEMAWEDVFCEQRHGTKKVPGLSINVLADLLPHMLSILDVLLPESDHCLQSLAIKDGGLTVDIELLAGGLPTNIKLSRVAKTNKRYVEIFDQSAQSHTLDFTSEPGRIYYGEKECKVADPNQMERGSLDIEFNEFFEFLAGERYQLPFSATNVLHYVETIEKGLPLILQQQEAIISESLFQSPSEEVPDDAVAILREHLLRGLLDNGLVDDPNDLNQIDPWVKNTFKIIHTLSVAPFTKQRDLIDLLKVTFDQLINLNSVIRNSEFCQRLIVEFGPGKKYWANSIIPLVETRYIEKTLANEKIYPHKVHLYPGHSCMFFCSFCGRNKETDAKYIRDQAFAGYEVIKSIIEQAPKNDPRRFYISGGLEPLTNPNINALINFAKEQGFELPLYTNGYLLTPSYLRRNKAIWQLESLRVSIYGSNKSATSSVTNNEKAHDQVRKNLISLLRFREAEKADTKLGLNFVILPGCGEQLLELAELMAAVNSEAGTSRQIDFLTVREDYSDFSVDRPTLEKDVSLIEVIAKFEERIKEPDLEQLFVDYGYALHGPSIGKSAPPLYTVSHSEMRPTAYPQLSVAIDILGKVFLYREAAFLDRPGSDRYMIGQVSLEKPLEKLIAEFVDSGQTMPPDPDGPKFMDIYDHVVTALLNQVEDDNALGVPFGEGPIKYDIKDSSEPMVTESYR